MKAITSMKTNELLKQFYKQLGRLLYAIAKVDEKIQKKEVEALNEFVSKELAFFETSTDSSGMNQAFYTYFEFEECINKKISIEEAHASFVNFLDANIIDLDFTLIEKSITAIEKIAGAYRKINKKEKQLINTTKSRIRSLIDLF
ncbi:MAG: hypothetical protein NTX97_13660 [Bacteroidetes bacterium]|nr:hypothetical protein [Bacteroidota bacterium]